MALCSGGMNGRRREKGERGVARACRSKYIPVAKKPYVGSLAVLPARREEGGVGGSR